MFRVVGKKHLNYRILDLDTYEIKLVGENYILDNIENMELITDTFVLDASGNTVEVSKDWLINYIKSGNSISLFLTVDEMVCIQPYETGETHVLIPVTGSKLEHLPILNNNTLGIHVYLGDNYYIWYDNYMFILDGAQTISAIGVEDGEMVVLCVLQELPLLTFAQKLFGLEHRKMSLKECKKLALLG